VVAAAAVAAAVDTVADDHATRPDVCMVGHCRSLSG
jgi:hypothetical protein